MSSTPRPAGSGRLPLPRLLAFATGSMPPWILAVLLGVYMPRFYAGHLGITLVAVGLTMASVRLTDLGLDVGLGWLMDKTNTRFGRYRPWYALSLPVLWLAVYRVFNPPAGVGSGYLFTWLIVLYLAYSILVLAHSAWAARLGPGYNERSRIFGWMQGMGLIGASAILGLPLLTGGRINPALAADMGAVGWVIIGLATVVVTLTLISAPEPPVAEIKKERTTLKDYFAVLATPSMYRLVIAEFFLVLGPAATGPIYLFFFHDAKGFPYASVNLLLIPYFAAGLVGAPFWARVSKRLGKPRTIQVAGLAYAVAQAGVIAVPAKLFWPTFAGMFACGFCAATFVFLIQSMMADVGDEIRLVTGKERSGILYAFVTMTQKFATSITVSVIFPILAVVGYNAKETAVNTPQAIRGLEMCYLFAPTALVAVGALLLIGYKLTPQRHDEIRAALDKLEAASIAEASLAGMPEEIPIAAAR